MGKGKPSSESESTSPLQPVDLSNCEEAEKEKKGNALLRAVHGSLYGRLTMAGLESIRASSKDILCISPWGDSSPLLLPSIRFRDVALQSVVVATGGTAAFAEPTTAPAADMAASTAGHSFVQVAIEHVVGFASSEVDDTVSDWLAESTGYDRTKLTTSKGNKTVRITLKFKRTLGDAQLGFFKGSKGAREGAEGGEKGLGGAMKDYVSNRYGWFSPYLYASARRPVIPRRFDPDVVFSHGPFINGDYDLARALLREASKFGGALNLCEGQELGEEGKPGDGDNELPQRRLLVTVLGIKPYRAKTWASSGRPGESIIKYTLLDLPAVILPARKGAPLTSWHTFTLNQLHQISLNGEVPSQQSSNGDGYNGKKKEEKKNNGKNQGDEKECKGQKLAQKTSEKIAATDIPHAREDATGTEKGMYKAMGKVKEASGKWAEKNGKKDNRGGNENENGADPSPEGIGIKSLNQNSNTGEDSRSDVGQNVSGESYRELEDEDQQGVDESDSESSESSEGGAGSVQFASVANSLYEFISLCTDLSRVREDRELGERRNTASSGVGGSNGDGTVEEPAKDLVRSAVELLLEGAVMTRESKTTMDGLLAKRTGIVVLRMP